LTDDARDYGAEVNALVASIEADPANAATQQELLRVAAQWLTAEGLDEPSPAEREERVRLAGWCARLVGEGAIAHFGWREGAVAAALGSRGARVSSLLDHPGRAMIAALRHGSEGVVFGVHAQEDSLPRSGADLVVVETAGVQPVIDPAGALRCLRAEGFLAILGMPVMLDLPGTIEVACFRDEKDAGVVPCRPGESTEMLTLLRSTARPRVPGGWSPREEPAPESDAPVDPAAVADEFKRRLGHLLERGD